jgi:hypothetical protein
MAGKKIKEGSDYAGHKANQVPRAENDRGIPSSHLFLQVASGARQAKVDAKKSMDK